MIKLVITDGDGTLYFPTAKIGTRKFLNYIHSKNILHCVASNRTSNFINSNFNKYSQFPKPNLIVSSDYLNSKYNKSHKKPDPIYVDEMLNSYGIKKEETIFLGDADNDIYCAINAGVLPIAAKYSKNASTLKYGLPVKSIVELIKYIKLFSDIDAPFFGWEFNSLCPYTKTDIQLYSLISDQRYISKELKSLLKENKDTMLKGKYSLLQIIRYYLISALHQSGILNKVDKVTIYPGHQKGSTNQTMKILSQQIKNVSSDSFIEDLLIRHIDAPESKMQGPKRNIIDQLNTIHVNKIYKDKIKDKTILVLDDYTTYGYSLETARRMLLAAGAKEVLCISIARFRQKHSIVKIKKGGNPFQPCKFIDTDIKVYSQYGTNNSAVDDYFHNDIIQELCK